MKEDNWTSHTGFIHQVLHDEYLKNHDDPTTKGTIHKVLVTLSVAATSMASSPIIDAAPITEAVS